MRLERKGLRFLAVLLGLSLFAAACGDDDGDDGAAEEEGVDGNAGGEEGGGGGEFIDLGTFLGDPPQHLDPALNTTLDAYQVINALYDGLTDIDARDPANPKVVPHVAESFESNDDATVWTFKIREGVEFSNGEEILPSTFQKSWERASDPEFAGDYSYLMNFIDGGAEKLDGKADSLAGVDADDDAMTLTVTLSAPYSNFPAVAGFQLFMPLPSEATDAADFSTWENGVMIGNGPYKMETARTDEEIVIVKNDNWAGDANGETWDDRLDKVTFKVSADDVTAYQAFEAGEGDSANIPPARWDEANEQYATTSDVGILGSYHYVINNRKPEIGGEKNLKLRQAISLAIDRDEINEAVYNGSRTVSTGITPPGIPGFEEGLCDYCSYDPVKAKELFEEWQAEGNSQSAPLTIQFNRDNGHEPVIAIMVDNLAAVGIQAVADGLEPKTYFSQLADGACVICRAGWFADYPTYDNFMYDLFHSDSLGGNNFGNESTAFDELVDEAKQTVDTDEQASLFQQAEQVLLNDDTMAIPLNWYLGDYVYNPERIAKFPQTNFGLILWEQVQLAA
ncbi:MAG: ABC transporter substrate-binding protein [Acidimicrobiia bacterium]